MNSTAEEMRLLNKFVQCFEVLEAMEGDCQSKVPASKEFLDVVYIISLWPLKRKEKLSLENDFARGVIEGSDVTSLNLLLERFFDGKKLDDARVFLKRLITERFIEIKPE